MLLSVSCLFLHLMNPYCLIKIFCYYEKNYFTHGVAYHLFRSCDSTNRLLLLPRGEDSSDLERKQGRYQYPEGLRKHARKDRCKYPETV